MKKIIAFMLVIALTAAISIGATLAYLTDTDEDVNVMTLGKVKIDQLEYERIDVESKDADAEVREFHDNKPLYPAVTGNGFDYTPGDTYVDWEQIGKDGYTSDIWDPAKINNEVDKMVFIKNKGDYDAYVRSVFAFEAGKYTTLDQFRQMVHLNLNETDYTWEWVETPMTIGESTYFVATATYNKVLAPGALTEISLSQIALDSSATNEDVEAFGDTYQVLVKSQGIQADGFTDAKTALDEGFGTIAADNIPWENDAPTKGIDMITAVNTYNGKSITSKVQSIVFGKNSDHSEMIARNEGVLVDVEQDVPVYAYYVENNGLYQIYLLADDTIYWPKDSTKMFNGMANLTTMDTDNMSTERTTTFKGTFQGCNKLKELDVTNWDTSNVTDMIAAFNWCYELKLIGYENWDTSKVTNMAMLFQSNRAATELDLSKWDMSSVTTIASMFQDCQNLVRVDATGWDISNVTTMNQTFLDCFKLTEVKGLPEWDTSNVTNFAMVFYRCKALEYVDVTKWDVGNGEVFNSMFATTPNLVLNKTDLKGWDMHNAVRINHMFYGASAMPELDLGGWNMPKLITTSHMFADCSSLKTVNFDDWNTPSLVSLDCIFNDCVSLGYVDMSDIDTANVTEFSQMFERCKSLQRVDGMENWDTSKSGTFAEMFLDCHALEELNWSSFDTRAAYDNYYDTNNSYSPAFVPIFSGVNNLTKLIVSDKISYYGNGTVPEANKLVFPDPKPREGYTAMWCNVETGELYLGKDIPEFTAATYVAHYEYIPKGATVYNALNHLNADPNGTKITANVANITFGLRKDYESITGQYTGVLADAEQNGPAYAYYVLNGSDYDVYVLSDDVIYAPTDCSNLCNGMSKLVSFDTSNLDFSRTTSMYRMLRDCGKLSEIDVSGWNTANVTNMRDLFRGCKSIAALDVADWKTGKVETMLATFQDCALLEELDLNQWDVSKVTETTQMFNRCYKLKTLKLDQWNPKSVSVGTGMFQSCSSLTELDLSHWDTSSLTMTNGMFNHCEALTELNVSTWNMSKVTDTSLMFQACYELEQLDVSKWNTSSVVNMSSMFYECFKLQQLNVGSWNVSNVTNFKQIFVRCYALENVNGLGKWVTTNVKNFENMFNGCTVLKELDLSGFDTRQATTLGTCLYRVTNLEKLIVGEHVAYYGNGNVSEGNKLVFPDPKPMEGFTAKWRNVETGELYLGKDIPEKTAATYEACYEPIATP